MSHEQTLAPATPAVLEARSIVKNYGHVQALRGASLSIHAGEIVGLVGDDGARSVRLRWVQQWADRVGGEVRDGFVQARAWAYVQGQRLGAG